MKYEYTWGLDYQRFGSTPYTPGASEVVSFSDYQLLSFLFRLKEDFLLLKKPISTLNHDYLKALEGEDSRRNRVNGLNLDEFIDRRLNRLDEIEQHPSILEKFGPAPIAPKDTEEVLTVNECYKALSKKLARYLSEEREALAYVKRGFFTKKWQHKKMLELEEEKIRNIFNIFFKAYFGELPPESVSEGDSPVHSYLEKLSGSYKGAPPGKLFMDNDGNNGAVFWILAVATLFTSAFLYYLLNQILESMERFYFDENWLKASITLASMVAGGVLGCYFGFFIVAGATPIGLGIGVAVFSALVIATITTWVSNVIQNYFFESFNLNALDPADNKRYELDQKQTKKLAENGFNIDVVKCTLAALRKELIDLEVETLPTFMTRFISSTPKITRVNEILKSIRALRDGTYHEDTLQADGMTFNLKEPRLDLEEGQTNRGQNP